LGITSAVAHEVYQEKYPQGYKLEWIDEDDLDNHKGFQKTLALNKSKHENQTAKE
jgi:hypothetical protein